MKKFVSVATSVVLMFAFSNSRAASITAANNLTAPIIAATDTQLKSTSLSGFMQNSWLDTPISALGDNYYIATHSKNNPVPDTLRHVLTKGDYTNPYDKEQWVKETCQRAPAPRQYCVNQQAGTYAFTSFAAGLNDVVNLFFTSVYNAGGTERLAFIHEENAGWTGSAFNGASTWEGETRIGLAYSRDSGNTWQYLGRIAAPYNSVNIQGAPYIVSGGNFYVWYWDNNGSQAGHAVSKAKISDVLTAARLGNVGNNLWQKKTPPTTNAPDGWSNNIAAVPAFISGVPAGIVHSQAVHSTADGKYYVALSYQTGGAWQAVASYVKLYTIDPITLGWTYVMDIASEPNSAFSPVTAGYQYVSLVDTTGASNGEVGSSFYVYSGKFKGAPSGQVPNQTLYQWKVNVNAPNDFYKLSKDFSTTQGGGNWSYSTLSSGNMVITQNTSSQISWSASNDQYNRIIKVMDPVNGQNVVMSTGGTDGFLLIWTAPKTGNITLRQTARIASPLPNCGVGLNTDGVTIAIQKNSIVVTSATIGPDDTNGVGTQSSLSVAAGDHLYFYGTKGVNNYCDNIYWDPSITYQ